MVFPEKGVGSILGKPSLHNVLAVSRKTEFAVTHLSPKSGYLGLEHARPGVGGWVCRDCRAAGTFARLWGCPAYLQLFNCCKMPWKNNAGELPRHQALTIKSVSPLQVSAGGR